MTDLNELSRPVPSSVNSMCLTSQEVPATASAVQDIVLDWLQTLYLELGADDEVEPAREDLAAGLTEIADATS